MTFIPKRFWRSVNAATEIPLYIFRGCFSNLIAHTDTSRYTCIHVYTRRYISKKRRLKIVMYTGDPRVVSRVNELWFRVSIKCVSCEIFHCTLIPVTGTDVERQIRSCYTENPSFLENILKRGGSRYPSHVGDRPNSDGSFESARNQFTRWVTSHVCIVNSGARTLLNLFKFCNRFYSCTIRELLRTMIATELIEHF